MTPQTYKPPYNWLDRAGRRRLPKDCKDYSQDDVAYCCLPYVRLFDLAREAIALNPELFFITENDWYALEARAQQTTYQNMKELNRQAKLAKNYVGYKPAEEPLNDATS